MKIPWDSMTKPVNQYTPLMLHLENSHCELPFPKDLAW